MKRGVSPQREAAEGPSELLVLGQWSRGATFPGRSVSFPLLFDWEGQCPFSPLLPPCLCRRRISCSCLPNVEPRRDWRGKAQRELSPAWRTELCGAHCSPRRCGGTKHPQHRATTKDPSRSAFHLQHHLCWVLSSHPGKNKSMTQINFPGYSPNLQHLYLKDS